MHVAGPILTYLVIFRKGDMLWTHECALVHTCNKPGCKPVHQHQQQQHEQQSRRERWLSGATLSLTVNLLSRVKYSCQYQNIKIKFNIESLGNFLAGQPLFNTQLAEQGEI